jgi:hypothetical protein
MKNNTIVKSLLGINYEKCSSRTRALTNEQKFIRDVIVAQDGYSHYEDVDCYCGINKDLLISKIDRYGIELNNKICINCGLVRLTPRWNESRYAKFYENEYRKLYNVNIADKRKFILETINSPRVKEFTFWLRGLIAIYFEKYSTKLNQPCILEIGSGGGWNLAGMPDEWNRIGYDVDNSFLQTARDELSIDMRYGMLEDSKEAIPIADVVILSHVVEHLMDPLKSLRFIAERISINSLLIIEVPGIFSLHNVAYDPMTHMQKAHTFGFCAETLSPLIRRAGFEILEINERCRVVARLKNKEYDKPDYPKANITSERIVNYYKACEFVYKKYLHFKKLPIFGRVIARVWRDVGFKFIGVMYAKKMG